MNCPKCTGGKLDRLELQVFLKPLFGQGRRELLELDQCSACQGIWFDPGELELYLKQHLTAADSVPAMPLRPDELKRLDDRPMSCIRCSEPMFKWPATLMSSVQADYCPKCLGVWLDAGEIDLLEKENVSLGTRVLKGLQGLFGKDRWDVHTK